MHGKRVNRARIKAHGNDSPQTKTTNKAINYTAVQAQVALRGSLTTINGSSAGITADSYAEPRASKCRLSVLPAYCRRIASVTTDVGRGRASADNPPWRGIKAPRAAVCEDGGLARKNDSVNRF